MSSQSWRLDRIMEHVSLSPTLTGTALIDISHKTIIQKADDLVNGLSDNGDRARAIHRFVRDRIAFGFVGAPWNIRASDVLHDRIGYSMTKTSLFVALVRAAGIPARIVFTDIGSEIFTGFLEPGTPLVDHCYAELWLNDRWLSIDSHIVDAPLFQAAQAQLQKEGRTLGYGVHVDGTINWDGQSDSFVQLAGRPEEGLAETFHGRFGDADMFHKATLENRMKQGMGSAPRLFLANRRVTRIRHNAVARTHDQLATNLQ